MKIMITFLFFALFTATGYGQTLDDAMQSFYKGDYSSAITQLEKLCKNGNMDACYNLGFMYAGEPNNKGNKIAKIEPDYQKALQLFTLACDNNHGAGCNNLAMMYWTGHGIKKDMVKHDKFREKACMLNHGKACWIMGFIYGQKKEYINYKKALFFSQKACDIKEPCGCADIAILYTFGRGVAKDQDKVQYYNNLSNKYGTCKR